MRFEILKDEIFPVVLRFFLLLMFARISDELLHGAGFSDVGRDLAIPGVGLMMISFVYSLRKKISGQKSGFSRAPSWFKSLPLKPVLTFHEIAALLGVYLVLIHAGIHMHALLPWAAVFAMLTVVISGFTGHVLYLRVRKSIETKRDSLLKDGHEAEDVEEKLFRASVMAKTMLSWRKIHFPLTAIFTALALLHVLSAVLFQGNP